MEVSFGNMQVKLNVFQASQQPHERDECLLVDVVDEIVEEALPSILVEDPLEACLAHFGFENFDIDGSVKEALKLLDAGIIYPISDSKWVSPTQVVPKKSGITVVENEGGELVPTRTTTG